MRSLLFFVFSLTLLVACQRDHVPPLVEVTEVSPKELELGDRLEIRGAGFPQGRVAHVAFRGTLHRPGETSTTVHADAEGVVGSPERIDVAWTDRLEEAFCGKGDAAAHATFDGEVEVGFASSLPGAPPIVGTLRAVTLDARPSSVRAAVAEGRLAEGARLLAFLGVTPGPASGRGIPVDIVAVGSPAERADIHAGDVITTLDGARVASAADLVPASARSVALVVRRADSAREEPLSIPLVGFASERIPVEYGSALLLVGLALALLVLLVVPSPAALRALESRVASRLRGASWRFGARKRLAFGVLASLLVGTFALGSRVIDADADGPLLLLTALALLTAARITAAGGMKSAALAALELAALGLLLALFALGLAVTMGSIQLSELVRAQGGAPWAFSAMRRPAAAILAAGYLATLFAMVRVRVSSPLRGPTVDLLERLGLLFASSVGVAIFFGGSCLPGVDGLRSLTMNFIAASVFVAKTWLVTGLLRGSASVATPWTGRALATFCLRRIVPLLALGLAVGILMRRVSPGSSFEAAWGATMMMAIVLLVVRSALRVREALLRPEPQASPFL